VNLRISNGDYCVDSAAELFGPGICSGKDWQSIETDRCAPAFKDGRFINDNLNIYIHSTLLVT